MKLKRTTFLLLAGIMIFSGFCLLYIQKNELNKNEIVSEISQDVFFPNDLMCATSGNSYSTTGFESNRTLYSENGKYVYFYIENIGEAAFSASINGESEHIFEPNDKGYVRAKVNDNLLSSGKEYTFKVASIEKSWGKKVGISYMIGQKGDK